MHTSLWIHSLENLKVTFYSPEFGYVEFMSAEVAQAVLCFKTHLMFNKSISVQETKGKGCQPTKHKGEEMNAWKEEGVNEIYQLPTQVFTKGFINKDDEIFKISNLRQSFTSHLYGDIISPSCVKTTQNHLLNNFLQLEYENMDFHREHIDQGYGPGVYDDDVHIQLNWKESKMKNSCTDFCSYLQPVKAKRPFKIFYKHLKRPHIKARMIKKQENNYVFHRLKRVPSYLANRELHQQEGANLRRQH